MSRVELLGVVVPARDEEELLPRCLAALAAAARAPELAGTAVQVVVVADGCTDGTAAVARRAGVTVLVDGRGGNVGAARRRGVLRVLADAGRTGTPADRVWVAATDADSRVPEDWLVLQVTAAQSGADALVGTVEVDDWTGFPAEAVAAFTADYGAWRAGGPGAVHPHVHGANLGVRGSAYLQAGGFPALAVDEDRSLVDALGRGGWNVLRAPAGPVRTSARRVPRARGGLGTDLAHLATRFDAG
ncbi:glycosyltransferase [Modestobacter sp. VKM Ac-2985]|uniref:glycosyltransferase n=1 Tax=Modestobacter sp. VKM Ac-2985 TaxID=3004139 RepID=UPI0022ABC3FF|nr:glycosyltransferase [Modestobacter sp. VKM Ac-2985]MCZ2837348.1 glycosyltransferase [Modestobacter sp. VKM Ac-2985]